MRIRNLVALACILGASVALADPAELALPSTALKPIVDGAWTVETVADPAGAFDRLVSGTNPALSVLVGVGADCDAAFNRYTKRAGLLTVARPAYAPARYSERVAEDVSFASDTTTDVLCAPVGERSLVAVVSYGGLPEAVGADATAMLAALALALETGGDGALAFTAPEGPVTAPLSSAAARARFMVDPAAAEAALARRTGSFMLAKGSSVIVVNDGLISSKKSKKGEPIVAHVNDDVIVDDAVVIAKGAPVVGRVVDASSGGMGGSPGKIKYEFTATTAVDGSSVVLDYQADKVGKAEGGYSFFTGINLSSGGQFEVTPGTPMEAKTKADANITVK